MRWVWIRHTGWGGTHDTWQAMRGRRYATEAGARKAGERMARRWDDECRKPDGRIHPSHFGKWHETHRLIEVRDEESAWEAIERIGLHVV